MNPDTSKGIVPDFSLRESSNECVDTGLNAFNECGTHGRCLETCKALAEEVPKINKWWDEFHKAKYEQALEIKLAEMFAEVEKIRDWLYDSLPTGDVDAFTLLKLINKHIENLDDFTEALKARMIK